MLHYAAGFLLSALIAAVLVSVMSGSETSWRKRPGSAKTLFVVFVLGAVATLLLHRSRV